MLSCWKRTDAPRRENRAVRTTRLPPDGRCDAHRENTKLPNAPWSVLFTARVSYTIAAGTVTPVYLLPKYPQFSSSAGHCVTYWSSRNLNNNEKHKALGGVARTTDVIAWHQVRSS